MSLDALRESLPAYARDLSLNLSALAEESQLTGQQKWGAFVATAHAAGCGPVIRALEAAAREAGLSPDAMAAAKAAAAIMGMNNVYYRSLHLMRNQEYRTLPSRLRMTVIANPGAPKTDFEMWCAAVSAVNGCGMCLDSHEHELKKAGVPTASVQAVIRIAAVVNAVSRVIAAEEAAAA